MADPGSNEWSTQAELELERKHQREVLEYQLKKRLETECEYLQELLKSTNRLAELKKDMLSIKAFLVNDFEGKAKEALNERLTENLTFLEQTSNAQETLMESVSPADKSVQS